MSSISQTLRSFSDLVSMKPAVEQEIVKAEKQLNLSFAEEFKEYASEFGAVAANGHELTGVVSSKRLDVVTASKREWELNSQVPHSMYVIENVGIDGIIIWQDVNGKIFQSVPDRKPQEIAVSMAEYVLSH